MAGSTPAGSEKPTPPIDPTLYHRDDLRAVLAAHDIAGLYQLLKDTGLTQRDIAALTGQSQMPSRLSGVHVEKVRDLTRRLGEAGCAYGSDPEVSSAAAAWATRLLSVPGAEPVKQALMTAAAELHIEAGWGAFDAGLYGRAMWHYARAADLATEAYCQALALNWTGLATVEHGQPNDGWKMLQCGGVRRVTSRRASSAR